MVRAIGIELRTLSNLCMRYSEKHANKARVDAITGTNGWIIGYIAHSEREGREVYQRDLEGRFGVTRSTASKVVNLMVQKGLIERVGVPRDARLKRLMLTARARDITRMMDEDHRRVEETLRAGFTQEELNTFFSYLDRMKANLSDTEAQGGQEGI